MLCHHPPLFLPRHRDIQRSEHTAGSQHRWVSMTKIRPSYFFVLTFPQPPLTIFHIYSLATTILCAAVVVIVRHWVEFAHFLTAKKIRRQVSVNDKNSTVIFLCSYLPTTAAHNISLLLPSNNHTVRGGGGNYAPLSWICTFHHSQKKSEVIVKVWSGCSGHLKRAPTQDNHQ